MESHEMSNATFTVGQIVIYPMLGKCTVVGIEKKDIAGQTLSLDKLEVQKSSFSRSTRQDPAVWVPVGAASDKGLRSPLQNNEVATIFQVLSSREYYFDLNRPWSQVQPELEAAIRREGAIGLAKSISYLFVLKKKQIVPTPEINRFSETVERLFFRELSERPVNRSKISKTK